MESNGHDDIPVQRGEQVHTHAPKTEEGLQRNCISRMKDVAKGGTIPIPTIYTNYSRAFHESDPLASAALLSKPSMSATLYGLAEAAILHYQKLWRT